MRIVSKQRDYYDSIQGMGVDMQVHYIRKEEEIAIDPIDKVGVQYEGSWDNSFIAPIRFEKVVIGFCGEFYPAIVCEEEVFYDEKSWEKRKEANRTSKHIKYYKKWLGKNKKGLKNKPDPFWDKNEWGKEYGHLFQKLKVPIFVFDRRTEVEWLYGSWGRKRSDKAMMTVNCLLNYYDFQKIKDPYTAYQEIYQYISGVLGVGEPNLVEISNEDMRDKKGFDAMSFKKEKGDKKRKGKSKRK